MRKLVLFAPALAATFAAACSDSGPSGPKVGPAANVLIQAGATQVAVAGQATPIAPSVLVTDANNLPVPGAVVTFTIISGGGSLSGATQTTGPTGVATVTWTLGTTFGVKLLSAGVGALLPVTFAATAIAPDAGVVAFDVTDPANDTLSDAVLGAPQAIDLINIHGDFKRDSLIVTLTFGGPVSPASIEVDNSLAGFIEFDIDDNPATGAAAVSDDYGAASGLGIEYFIELFSSTPTSVVLVSSTTSIPVPASFSENTVTVRIPMSAIGRDDGNFGVVTVLGTLDRATDVAPNSGQLTSRRSVLSGGLGLADRLSDSHPALATHRLRWGATAVSIGGGPQR
jgi:hypothetical protein